MAAVLAAAFFSLGITVGALLWKRPVEPAAPVTALPTAAETSPLGPISPPESEALGAPAAGTLIGVSPPASAVPPPAKRRAPAGAPTAIQAQPPLPPPLPTSRN
jgi:hypothetical protein